MKTNGDVDWKRLEVDQGGMMSVEDLESVRWEGMLVFVERTAELEAPDVGVGWSNMMVFPTHCSGSGPFLQAQSPRCELRTPRILENRKGSSGQLAFYEADRDRKMDECRIPGRLDGRLAGRCDDRLPGSW